ncbi:MAG: sec-independent protein translocase protein TatA [Rhodospirillaceae bacterium]|nr:MAG: sec-independent protein translocase protein TatA [Rhodospirillaceae bacterium]
MGSWSIGHWVVVLLVVLLLFGAGKIPRLMGDMAKGVRAFKKGMKEEEEPETASPEIRALGERTSRTAEVGKDRIAHG